MIGYINIGDDLVIIDGSFEKGESNQQSALDILMATPGDYKQYPTVGASLINYLNSSNSLQSINRSIQLALLQDGLTAQSIDVVDGEIIIQVQEK